MIERDAVASLRRRAAPRNGISRGGLLTAQNTQQVTTDSTLNSPVRGLSLGGGTLLSLFSGRIILYLNLNHSSHSRPKT